MGLFHKKEKVPEVPLAPNLAELPEIPELPKEKVSELPSLPKGLGEQANRSMVKSAVNDMELPPENKDGIQELPKDFDFQASVMQTPPVVDLIPTIPKPEVKKIEAKPFVSNDIVAPVAPTSQDPIFVRIDRYQNAKKELDEINKNIRSVEAVLNKLGEIKSREDKEVGQISESLSSIKTRLGNIDSNVFKKV